MLITVGLLLIVALAWFAAPRLHRFAYWIDRKTEAEVDAMATGRWRVERLEVTPGVTLTGLVRDPAEPTGRWVLFVPGNSTALLDGFRAELESCVPADHGIAFFAYRGFEASGGTPTPADLLADLDKQWQLVRASNRSDVAPEVFGYSLGAVLAVQFTAQLCARGEAPSRLVLAAAGERIPIMRHGLFGRFLSDDVYDATAAAATVSCPVIIVHGADDDALPIATARSLRERIGDHATLHELPGKGHTDVWSGVAQHAYQ